MFATWCGVVLTERTPSRIVLAEPGGARSFALLHEMPFSSELKRMGVVLDYGSSPSIGSSAAFTFRALGSSAGCS